MIGQPERSCFDQDFNEKTETSIVLKLKKWIEHKRSQRLQSQMELRESDVTDLKVFSESIIAYKIITRRSDLLTEQENLTIEELIRKTWSNYQRKIWLLDPDKKEDLDNVYAAAGWLVRYYLLTGRFLGEPAERGKLAHIIKDKIDSSTIEELPRIARLWVLYRVLANEEPSENTEIRNNMEQVLIRDCYNSLTSMPTRDTEPITKDFSEPAIALGYLKLFQSKRPIRAGQIVLNP